MSEQTGGTLEIQESAAAPPAIAADGTVKLHLIRPCVGKGKGRHVYEAKMLAENAHVFRGWRMFVDHDTAAQRKQREGLPRSVDHLGGIVVESSWDPDVPAEGRFGQGAVVGTVRAVPKIVELLKVDPALVESSINARATGVRPVQREGGQAWLVEGIEPKGTVDWVTDGGAGGRVVSLVESVYGTPDEEETAVFDAMTDDEVRDFLVENRPALVEAFTKKAAAKGDGDAEDKADGGADEEAELVAEYVKKGMTPEVAKQAAKRKLAAAAQESKDDPEGAAVAVTPEDIQEAVLQSPEIATLIGDLVEARLDERLTAERQTIRAEAFADAGRAIELRDMRDTAHRKIDEAKLPERFAERAKAQFEIIDGSPTESLDVFETTDDAGEITETAESVLLKVVEAVVEDQRGLVASISKTRVRNQGAAQPAGDGSGEGGTEKIDRVGPLTRQMLEESNIDPDKAFDSAHALRG